jgi:mersacidin/lichenicidin family type 2 lantibiotic
VFQSAIEVFRNEAMAGVFGLPAAPGGNWPLDGALQADAASSDGAYLIEEMYRALVVPFNNGPTMTQHRFILLQRVAHYGAMTIAAVLDEAAGWDSADRVQALVRNAYGWEKALQALASEIDVVRAWKDPHYRQNLSPCEQEMMAPHPSGEVDLKDTKLNPSAARTRRPA